jgi:hypothetical protein
MKTNKWELWMETIKTLNRWELAALHGLSAAFESAEFLPLWLDITRA